MSRPFTPEQWETLVKWLASRTVIAIRLEPRQYDKTFVAARQKDLDELDAAARKILVEE